MTPGAPRSFGAQLKALRDAAGYTQEELATIAGLSVHAVSALERGERRRPQVETVRALSAALDLTGAVRDAFVRSARTSAYHTASNELTGVSVPLALTTLVGRDRDVETLRHWLADPAMRLITVTGPGGVGKTRLAVEAAHAIAAERGCRVAFVTLAAIRDPAFVAPAIAEALGLANVAAPDLPKRARVACADARTLLVLDNFEHVIDASPLVPELLTAVASLRVLVTSRALLHVRGEREYALGPLALEAGSEQISPADLARVPAVRLFVERVRDVHPDFRLTSANGPTVTAICRRLDALPLALELAAPWMKVLTAEDLHRRLEHDVLFPTVGARDLPARQQTMNATVAWSYQLLDGDERHAFRRFGVLPGPFPIDAAAAVLAGRQPVPAGDEALHAAAGLIDKSLLVRADSVVATCPLYQMLETVRAYAALELDASDERDDAMEGLVRYCADEASLAGEGLVGPSQVEWLARVSEDLASHRCVLAWLIERGRHAEAAAIAWALMFFWLIQGHAAEGLRWYKQIQDLPTLPPPAELKALTGAAIMWYWQGEHARARSTATRARALAHDVGDLEMGAQAEHLLGHVEYALGNVDAARDRFMNGIREFQALSTPWGTGLSLTGLAQVALATGDAGRAERLLDEAAPVLRDAGPWFLSLGSYIRANLAVRRRNADDAIALVRENLLRIRDLQDKVAFFYTLVPLAAAAVIKGEDAWAARILGTRDAVTKSTGINVVDPSMQDLQEAAELKARARLGPDRWAVAYGAGRKISIDALLKDIDGVLQTRPPAAAGHRNPVGRDRPSQPEEQSEIDTTNPSGAMPRDSRGGRSRERTRNRDRER